jgi:hypothetical protein
MQTQFLISLFTPPGQGMVLFLIVRLPCEIFTLLNLKAQEPKRGD